jgi:hypothetical protein
VTDIFQEVEEDVRREQMEKLMRRYGPYALAAILALVLAVGGFEFYKARHAVAIGRAAKAYVNASMQLETDPKAAAAAFATLAQEDGGYGLLSRFRQAEAAAAGGDLAGAANLLDAITQDKSVDPLLRDLARLKTGYLLLDTASKADLEARLGPLASGQTIWRYDAQGLLAFAALKVGERTQALARFKALASDEAVPPGLRRRASDMVLALGETQKAPEAPPQNPAKPGTTN